MWNLFANYLIMDKFLSGLGIGILFVIAFISVYPKGTLVFKLGMTYCKDNPKVCDKHYESVLLERQSQKIKEEAYQLTRSSNK